MNFMTAVRICLTTNYVSFGGRACRAEYWWFMLFGALVNCAAAIIDSQGSAGIAEGLVTLALFLPYLGVAVRRLHDVNRSGWWLLLGFVPLVGEIVLLIWVCSRGTQGANRFGGDPLANMAVAT